MKKRIFMTGATGVMGTATLNELILRCWLAQAVPVARSWLDMAIKSALYGAI